MAGTGASEVVTVFGRMPVLEALDDDRVAVRRVLVARTARGDSVDDILAAAARRGLKVTRVAPEKVTRISGNGRHDQGVVAEVAAPALEDLEAWLARLGPGAPASVVLLDGVTNPANVGMIVRTVTAAGLHGLVLPQAGSPEVGPLVIKASAGVAFDAAIQRCPTALAGVEALAAAGFAVYGLRGDDATTIYDTELADRAVFVLGNETVGVSPVVAERVGTWLSLPLHNGVESLNVASAAAVVAYELVRRRLT
ncbi:MAG TPA: RNA methyltransferase [Acidimicrobiales bacterium]|nr:RNA methyltransferase [Acidimicrobiales bacterium]